MEEVKLIFWISAGIVFYTYLGYGILLLVLVKIKEFICPPRKNVVKEELPPVTIVIAAYNEEDVAEEKMDNTLELDYPPEKLKILWITDG
ncbi:MAG: glycosyltransferase family 2 protein, partial [Bacteroidales bacterium]|nr:glycosyltransferase family 2 protein [Bacteroidales bacterium]